ncbi:MAG: reprolysin-like metallopeptidase [Phycisphaerales bacterium]
MFQFATRHLCAGFIALAALCSISAVAAPADGPAKSDKVSIYEPWEVLEQRLPEAMLGEKPFVRPVGGTQVMLDTDKIHTQLAGAPDENALDAVGLRAAPVVIAIPKPDGTFERFEIVESSIMEPELAAQYPEFKTYAGTSLDRPLTRARIDVTSLGFRAQVLSAEGSYWVDPVTIGDTNLYTSYRKTDLVPAVGWKCFVQDDPNVQRGVPRQENPFADRVSTGPTLRTYRIAVAATGEYTAFFGGTVALGQAAIVTAINRVTGVYQQELAVRLTLVANNSSVVYTSGVTDPYSNTNPSSLLTQNQTNLTNVIGSANYDIGHVFSTAGGGLASLGVVCNAASKARGETGTSSPTGDAFYIDYVAHEIGHQFGANHTFNTSADAGNRNAATAYEPGSGSTIMAYAGIEGSEDLQAHSDAYFHHASLDEITAYVASQSCQASAATGDTAPTVNAGSAFTIPTNTPYTLTGSATDPNADALTYCWEPHSLGPAILLTTADNGTSPIQRSLLPASAAFRQFPRNSNLVANTLLLGEKLPAVARSAPYRLTVRDGKGGVNSSSVTITVVSTGASFAVTAPNTAVSWTGLSTQSVTWNVAGTTANGINCASVDILLSTDGGSTFPTTLASAVPNNGSASIVVPNTATTAARIKVKGTGNIFFDISNVNFTITSVAAPAAPTTPAASPTSICPTATSSLSVNAQPAGVVVDWFTGSCGGTLVGTGNPLNVSPVATTTYFARARRTADGAVSATCASTSVTLNPSPVAPTLASVNRDNICKYDAGNIALSVTGGSGTTLRWFSGSCGGTLVGTGNNLSIASPTTNTTYFARWETSCGVSTCASVTFHIRACPADLNCDAQVDDGDFVLFLAAYNILACNAPGMPAGCPADLNGDGVVDDSDFVIFLAGYNVLVCP